MPGTIRFILGLITVGFAAGAEPVILADFLIQLGVALAGLALMISAISAMNSSKYTHD